LEDKVKLRDVYALTLRQGHMTNRRSSARVPQMKCVGGFAWCWVFVPKVALCHNKGSDGYRVQWECEADTGDRFGEIAVNCEGYDYPEDPYILEGSCGLEYTIDHVGGNSGNAYHHSSSYPHSNQHGNYGYKQHRNRVFPCSISTLIMWGIIAFIVYYIYSTCSANQHMTDSTQDTSQPSTYGTAPPPYTPPPPGFRPEYTQGKGGMRGKQINLIII
ncbi:store-operated calcium entry-associated regulatory factor-like, partial [Actinia tenebrosa]|uniref:Store-operated calcium entry-associated regulatory factor n=1 Tax=Actinia tenebrosa TaxID=6105 RepID=A0A6P8HQF1_ACTTE